MIDSLLQVSSVLAQFATVAALVLLYRQIEVGRKAARGLLIHELEKEFAGYYSVFAKLKPGGAWRNRAALSEDEIAQLENLASFCEKLKHFLDCGILDWITLDRMFRNRFFLIIHNPNVMGLIDSSRPDWESVIELQKDWSERLPMADERRNAMARVVEQVRAAQQPVAADGGPGGTP